MDQQASNDYHVPVLLHEAVDALNIMPDGTYVDCTFGGGGHAAEILKRLNDKGRLVAFDQDADAKSNLPEDPRIIFVPHNFRYLQKFLRLHKISSVNGVLADLGVSSHQFNEGTRGFSTRFDGALDMRMDKRQEFTAAILLNTYTETRLHKLFELYGEVTNSKTLAKTIVASRTTNTLKSIADFKNTVHDVVKGNPNKYFAQVFQALRIEVNDELGALKELLVQIPPLLKAGGRVSVITFHSLEDRLVKLFYKLGKFEEEHETDVFGNRNNESQLLVITKKPITANDAEVKRNPRARSAKLRVAEKI
ncbi:MAG: 16S rRNA (cytosine(1402)-N(4))-methyltransferase RsmH [Flavitalea sp.]